MGHVIRELNFEGRAGLTFGASATESLEIEHNLGGWKIKMLGKAYRKIVSRYGLANRGQFRVSHASFCILSAAAHRIGLIRARVTRNSKSSAPRTNRSTSPMLPARSAGPDSSP